MSRSPIRFWATIALVVFRLALGDTVHAMSHAAGNSQESVAASDCAEHTQHAAVSDSSSVPADQSQTTTPECCEQGACECPCVHAPCVIDPVTGAMMNTADRGNTFVGDADIEHDRLSSLLRPPA